MSDFLIFGFGLVVTLVVGFGLTSLIVIKNRHGEPGDAEEPQRQTGDSV